MVMEANNMECMLFTIVWKIAEVIVYRAISPMLSSSMYSGSERLYVMEHVELSALSSSGAQDHLESSVAISPSCIGTRSKANRRFG